MVENGENRWLSTGNSGPTLGRIVLLIGAYAPVALIIAARTLPDCVGYVAAGIGVAGLIPWLIYLRWMPGAQPREVDVEDVDAIDSEVTGYIVSILLPLVAAGDPSAGDLVAYSLCGVMILLIAYVSDLAVVNPLIYLLGYRVARATVDGKRTVVLIKKSAVLTEGGVTVVRAVGVTLIPGS